MRKEAVGVLAIAQDEEAHLKIDIAASKQDFLVL